MTCRLLYFLCMHFLLRATEKHKRSIGINAFFCNGIKDYNLVYSECACIYLEISIQGFKRGFQWPIKQLRTREAVISRINNKCLESNTTIWYDVDNVYVNPHCNLFIHANLSIVVIHLNRSRKNVCDVLWLVCEVHPKWGR